ncbi:MAG: site-specific integrase [Bacteroidales bacterium]|nr:site-specific integrase [Bacteroidales bacterium]
MHSKNHYESRLVNGYTLPRLVEGEDRWRIVFYAHDPESNTMKRKRYSVPPARTKAERRRYADEMIYNLSVQLKAGWNPFLKLSNPREYALFEDVCSQYYKYQYQLAKDNLRRAKTYNGYTSFLHGFKKWNDTLEKPVVYMFQLKDRVIDAFLDHIWIEEGRSARTRDNYLGWLKTFCSWAREKGFISDDPTAKFTMLQGKRKREKNRTVIPREEMLRLREHLERTDKHFLLASYILYYCFIRPKEMSYIKISDISVAKSTIQIHKEVAKNWKDAVVTVPDHVIKLMLDLEVLTLPGDYFLFSYDFRPGKEYRLPKYFCDGWKKVAKALKFPSEYKFYSLKDTGITEMIKSGKDLITVRDQARHHSLQMTDLYTPLAAVGANKDLKDYESYF